MNNLGYSVFELHYYQLIHLCKLPNANYVCHRFSESMNNSFFITGRYLTEIGEKTKDINPNKIIKSQDTKEFYAKYANNFLFMNRFTKLVKELTYKSISDSHNPLICTNCQVFLSLINK